MADAIAALHTELGFAAVEQQLKDVTGVWSSLKKLQAKAGTKAGLSAYKQFLVRCIKNLNAETDLTEPQITAACQDFGVFYAQQIDALGIEVLERARGEVWWAWMKKWYPADYEFYTLAFEACDARQTARRFELLKAALVTALTAYVAAVPREPDGP